MAKTLVRTYRGDLIEAYLMASRILLKHGIDFCCGGQSSLVDACREFNVDINLVLQELKAIQVTPVNRL